MSTATLVAASLTLKADPPPWTVADTVLARSGAEKRAKGVLARSGAEKIVHGDALTIVVTTGIEPSSNIGNALVSAMYGRSSELGLYLWGNPPLPTVQGLPPPVGGG